MRNCHWLQPRINVLAELCSTIRLSLSVAGLLVTILLTLIWLGTAAVFPQYEVVFRQQDNDFTLAVLVIILGCFTLLEGIYPEKGFGRA